MAGTAKKPSRSETLTIRLDPKGRFMLEFVARLRGQTITTVVERAITEAASRAVIDQEFGSALDWRDFWSVVDGERALKIARTPELFPTYEEERRLSFASTHRPFFFNKPGEVIRHYVEVLWPRIDEFVDLFESTKTTNYFAAGEAMSKTLMAAGLKPPDWPERPAPTKPAAKSTDLDDEIPF